MATRVLIKNINCTSKEELINLINNKFESVVVTDVHLLFKDKVFRRCAFVGLKTKEDAEKLRSLNGYFLGSSRIKVEYARTIVDQNLKRNAKVAVKETTPPTLEDVEKIEKSARLYITNIPYNCKESELKDYFSKFGPIAEVHLPVDKLTKKPKGTAYIQYMSSIDAVRLFCLGGQALRKQCRNYQKDNLKTPSSIPTLIYAGRNIFLYPSDPPVVNDAPINLKDKKLKDKKKLSLLGFNWNTLYLNPSNIIKNVAKQLNIDECNMLNVHEAGAAVRMSVAEVKELTSLKNWFEENGISSESFKNFDADSTEDLIGEDLRSENTILIKNISPQIDSDKLISAFQAYGTLKRFLLPPSRNVAIVEFEKISDAKLAFKSNSFKPINGLPMYLEWAPERIFKASSDDPKIVIADSDILEKVEDFAENDDPETTNHVSIFVKNINFDTRPQDFEFLFKRLPGFQSATLKTRQGDKGEMLSMGYGFVQFDSTKNAKNCIRQLSTPRLDHHDLILKISRNDPQSEIRKRKATDFGEASEKIVIKNVPFEATKDELHQLVSTVCSIQTIRLPKKFDGGHRGFCFVQCFSTEDAQKLIEKMNGVHLYGRKLVFMFSGIEGSQLSNGKKRKIAS
eukprot:NODE_9_length_64580_cov_1.431941.p8 type:complete len:625 gc:universal NODE_9_length_64580_cov_1.431941:41843-43717(+)